MYLVFWLDIYDTATFYLIEQCFYIEQL